MKRVGTDVPEPIPMTLCSGFTWWSTAVHAASRLEASIVDNFFSASLAAFTIAVGLVQPVPSNFRRGL